MNYRFEKGDLIEITSKPFAANQFGGVVDGQALDTRGFTGPAGFKVLTSKGVEEYSLNQVNVKVVRKSEESPTRKMDPEASEKLDDWVERGFKLFRYRLRKHGLWFYSNPMDEYGVEETWNRVNSDEVHLHSIEGYSVEFGDWVVL